MVVLLLIKPSGCSAMRPQAFMDTVFFTENSKGKRFDTTTHHVKGEFVKRARDFETTEGEIRMVRFLFTIKCCLFVMFDFCVNHFTYK